MDGSGTVSIVRATPAGAPRDGSADLVLRLLPSSARARAGQAWRAVESAAMDIPPFACWDWTQLWLEHYGEAVPHEYVLAERGGESCGVVLLTHSRRSYGPLIARRLHLGTSGELPHEGVCVEYNGLCTRSVDRVEVAKTLLAHLQRTGGWDELHLDGFEPAAIAPLLAAEPRFSVERRGSRVLDFDQPGDLVDALCSKSARTTVRRSLRGIAPYTTEWAEECERAHAILDDLERLHQQRWRARGQPGAFTSTRFRTFHRRLVERWLPEGRVVVFAVRQEGVTIAALYGFVVGTTLQFYQGGFRTFESNKVRVGYAAHLLLATAARERGLQGYEYLAGNYRYKTELSTSERTLVWATLIRRRPRALAISTARSARHALRRGQS
jgi:hypothetical protein